MSEPVVRAEAVSATDSLPKGTQYRVLFDQRTVTSFETYEHQIGESIKSERRTHIRKIAIDGAPYCLKIYRYPGLSGFRTWYLRSKAQREYTALSRCEFLHVNAVVPVGYSVARNKLGFVKQCCLLTQWESEKTVFKDWLGDEYHPESKRDALKLQGFLFEIGRQLKMLHENHLFMLTPFSKNIFVDPNQSGPESIQFLDAPYARELRSTSAAIWGQVRDLGAVVASTRKYVDQETFHAFYEGYGVDPFPKPNQSLDEKADVGSRVQLKQTLLPLALRMIRRGKRGKPSRKVDE